MGTTRRGHVRLRALLPAVLLTTAFLALATSARAAECTDTWTGPSGGEWQLAENWSAEHVPTSEDVACIPKESTAKVTEGTHFAELLQGEGRLTITGGSLGLLGSGEASNIGMLHLTGGALRGPNEIFVTGSLTADGGSMEGAGNTIVGTEASGVVEAPAEGEGPGLRVAEARTLTVRGTLGVDGAAGKLNVLEAATLGTLGEGQITVKGPEGRITASESAAVTNGNRLTVEGTEGRLTLKDSAVLHNSEILKLKALEGGLVLQGNAELENFGAVTLEGSEGEIRLEGGSIENAGEIDVEALGGRIRGSEGARIENFGTLSIDGQGPGNGMVDGEVGAVPVLTNQGTVLKGNGGELTLVEFKLDNEGLVRAEAGSLGFSGGGNSGQEATDYWTADGGAEIVFDEAAFTLGESAALSGLVLAIDGASVKAHKVAADEAELWVSESSLELTGAEEESRIGVLAVSSGEASVIANGELNVLEEADVLGGVLAIGADAEATIPVLLQEAGATEMDGGVKLDGGEFFLEGGLLALGAGCKCGIENVYEEGETEITLGDGSVWTGEGLYLNEGSLEAGAGATFAVTDIFNENAMTVGEESNLAAESLSAEGSLVVGNGSTVSGTYLFLEGEEVEFGAGVELTEAEIFHAAGAWSIGSNGDVTSVQLFESTGTAEIGAGTNVEVGEFYESEPVDESAATTVSLAAEASLNADEAFVGEGLLTGAGALQARELILGDATLSGSGLTEVTESGGVGGKFVCKAGECEEVPRHASVEGRKLVTHGFFTLGVSTMEMSNGALLENHAEFDASSETTGHGAQISIGESSTTNPKIVNSAEFNKESGTGTTEITVPFENNGTIGQFTGTLSIKNPIGVLFSERYGYRCHCGDPVETASGDLVESQTDISVPGLGIGLDLTRSYSAQAAAEAESPGTFGYGWTASFGDRLKFDEEGEGVTVQRADGSTVPFAADGEGSFEAPAWSQDTLSGDAEAGYTYTDASQVELHFSPSGALQSVTDRNGNETTLAYDESGQLESITDPAGRSITFSYDGEGLVESAEDPMGHVVHYAYEGGNLASVTMPGEESPRWQFGYDESHRMTSMIDGRGGEATNEYDGEGRVVSQTDPAGRTLGFEYDGFHTRITNEATGSVTDQWFNSDNEPFQITEGYGTAKASTEVFAYDEAGHLLERTDPNGHTTTYTYNGAGDRASMTDAAEQTTEWEYNGTHDVISETTPRGETTTIDRDEHGNPETISRPAPGEATQTTSFEYDAYGQLEAMTDPLGHTWSYEHDEQGDLSAETDPEGNTTSWEYDEDSRLLAKVSPRGNAEGAEAAEYTTSYERDAQGRPLKVTDPLGHATEYSYDGNGNVKTETDANGHTTTYTYNADDERTKVEKPNGDTTETDYDGAGKVTSQTDGNGQTTEYVRDVLERPVEVIDPLGRTTNQEYDAVGNLAAKTDPEERTTTYSYDNVNRLTEVAYSDESTPDAAFSYDADGNLVGMSDGTGESGFEYDQLDRLTGAEDGHGDAVAYAYDLANQQTGITYPNGKAVSRTFDKAGRLADLTDWLGNTTSFAYDRDSALTTTSFPEGTGNVDEYDHDRADRISEITMRKGEETLAALGYSRDALGQVEAQANVGLPGPESEAFSYDENNRLVEAGSEGFEYDAADNMTKAPGTTNAYDEASQLETGGGVEYAYDKEGERTKTEPTDIRAATYQSSFGKEGAGNGEFKYVPDVAIAPDGTLWAADIENNRVQHFSASGEYVGQIGPLGSKLNHPFAVEVDGEGNVYVSDNTVEKYSPEGEHLQTLATQGSGEGQVNFAPGLDRDSEGNLWVADSSNGRVEEFNPKGEYVKSITGRSSPWGVSVSPATGDIWVAERGAHRITVFDSEGEELFHFGSQGTGNGQFKEVSSVEVADGYAWVGDAENNRVQIFDEEGNYVAQFGEEGTGDGQFKTRSWIRVALNGEGDLWVTDSGNDRVERWEAQIGQIETTYQSSFGKEGAGNGEFKYVPDVAIAPDGTLWAADIENNRVQHFSASGEYVGQIGPLGSKLNHPFAVEVDGEGNVYVSDNTVEKYSPEGEHLQTLATQGSGEGQVNFAPGLDRDSEGNLWVADSSNGRVEEFNPKGEYVKSITGRSSPWGVSVSPATGDIWVAERGAHRITVFDSEGEELFHFGSQGTGNGQFKEVSSVEVADGYAWVGDAENNRVQIFDEEGNYVAQFGEEGTGDGQFKTRSWIRVALNGEGDLWVTDSGNDRVERWAWEVPKPEPPPATTYTYDQAGNLSAVDRPEAGELPAIEEAYAYDGTGLRASQTVSGATSQLTWDTSGGLALLLDDGHASYIYGPGGLPIEQISEGTPTFYHHDQLGSTRMLTNASGEPTATFTYSAYGQPAGSTGTQTTPLGYAGQYTNEQSGLIYLRARVYDPVTGQFLTRDPIEALTRQPYAYVNDNPLANTDPSGLRAGEAEISCPWCLPAPPPPETWKKAGEELAEPIEHLWNSIFGNESEPGLSEAEEHQLEAGQCRAEEFGWRAEGRKELKDPREKRIEEQNFMDKLSHSNTSPPSGGPRWQVAAYLVWRLITHLTQNHP